MSSYFPQEEAGAEYPGQAQLKARITALERLVAAKDEALRLLQKHLSVHREWHALGIVEAALDLTETEDKSC